MHTTGSNISEYHNIPAKHAPVAVIIPCYRCAETLARAVDSVLHQTVIPAELIFVEDASSDDGATLEAIRLNTERAKERMRVICVVMPVNAGPASARNAGWDKAGQRYVAFLDADDSWHSRKIELQVGWMLANDPVRITGHGSKQVPQGYIEESVSSFLPLSRITANNMLWQNPFSTRSVMLKTDTVFRFPSNMYYAEDGYLWANILCSNDGVAYLSSAPLAFSYKSNFGSSGLSANLVEMEKGELKIIRLICRLTGRSFFTKNIATAWSMVKFFRRVLLSSYKKQKTK